MANRYPQGLRKNPIVIKNTAGQPVRSFNSYHEALDEMGSLNATNTAYDPHYQERWKNADKKQASNKQALAEGFKAPKVGPLGSYDASSPTQGKINAYNNAITNRNQSWMNAVSKPMFPTLNKQIMTANAKRK